MPVEWNESARTWTLSGGNVSYVLHRDDQDRLLHLYWGPRLPADALRYEPSDYYSFASFDLPVSVLPSEIPVCGTGWFGTPAVGIRDAKGAEVVDLKVVSAEILPGKPLPDGLPAVYTETDTEADSLSVSLEDAVSGLRVMAVYSVFTDSGAVTRRLILKNAGRSPLTVTSLLSASVPLWQGGLVSLNLIEALSSASLTTTLVFLFSLARERPIGQFVTMSTAKDGPDITAYFFLLQLRIVFIAPGMSSAFLSLQIKTLSPLPPSVDLITN